MKRFVVMKLCPLKVKGNIQMVEKPMFSSDSYKEAEIWQWDQEDVHQFYIEDSLYPEGFGVNTTYNGKKKA